MFSKSFLVSAFLAATASAHYSWSGLVVNGDIVGNDWQYIREHKRGYMPTFREEAATSDEFRCNQGAGSGANTEVYTVKPGDTLGLRQAFGVGGMEHPGPIQVYMSQAPDSVKEYDGSGDWFKVFQGLVCADNPSPSDFQTDAWCMWGEDTITFTVPETVPDGEYLVRGEHIALHGAHDANAEFYYACAQIKVEGSSASTLPSGPTTKIPGVYKPEDGAINFSVWGQSDSYDFIPGIDVAAGGQIRGSANGAGGDAVVVVDDDGSGSTPTEPVDGGEEENEGGEETGGGAVPPPPAPTTTSSVPLPTPDPTDAVPAEPLPVQPEPEKPETPQKPGRPGRPSRPGKKPCSPRKRGHSRRMAGMITA